MLHQCASMFRLQCMTSTDIVVEHSEHLPYLPCLCSLQHLPIPPSPVCWNYYEVRFSTQRQSQRSHLQHGLTQHYSTCVYVSITMHDTDWYCSRALSCCNVLVTTCHTFSAYACWNIYKSCLPLSVITVMKFASALSAQLLQLNHCNLL